ncbi:MAG TPA: hypothetical protein PKH31_15085 [Candidatus Sumerlaeota bacterium]|nr:hypothetical protein [Candidatus Sumerlaeota bacterium]
MKFRYSKRCCFPAAPMDWLVPSTAPDAKQFRIVAPASLRPTSPPTRASPETGAVM